MGLSIKQSTYHSSCTNRLYRTPALSSDTPCKIVLSCTVADSAARLV